VIGVIGIPQRGAERVCDVGGCDCAPVVSVGAAQEGQHVVVEQVGDGCWEAGAGERDGSFFPEAVLNGRGQLPQPGPFGSVQFVDGDEQTGSVVGEVIGQGGQLRPQVGSIVRRGGLPGQAAEVERERDRCQLPTGGR
jgi:hypothetical protein